MPSRLLAALFGLFPSLLWAGSTGVLYFENVSNRCAWKHFDLSTRRSSVYLVTDKCPGGAVWDSVSKTTFFDMGGKVYSHKWKSKAKPTLLADCSAEIPKAVIERPTRLWFKPGSRELRRAILYYGPDVELVKKEGARFFSFRGKEYPSATTAIGAPALIGESRPTHGKCVPLAYHPSEWEACDTLGIEALDTTTAEKSVSQHALAARTRCGALECDAGERKKMLELTGVPLKEEGTVGFIGMKTPGTGFLYAVDNCDGKWCLSAPAYFCEANCKKRVQLEGVSEVTRVTGYAVEGQFALVQANGIQVYEFPSPKPILDVASVQDGVAVPFSAFWDGENYPIL